MSKTLKRSCVLVLMMALAFCSAAFIIQKGGANATMAAAEQVFYMNEGAEVRIGGNSVGGGIRFSATVGKAFLDSLHEECGAGGTVRFYSVVNRAGNDSSTEKIVEIPSPTAADGGDYILKTSVVYDNLTKDDLARAVGVELTAVTKIDVTTSENVTTTYTASGEAGARSMRAVANAAHLDWSDQAGYSRADLEKYLGTVTRSGNTDGKLYGGGILDMDLSAFGDSSAVIYIGSSAKAYTATKSAAAGNRWTVAGLDTEAFADGEQVKVSVFGADNAVSTFNAAFAQANYITQENIADLQTATTGLYILKEDIDMTGISWAPTSFFAGTFDGDGHSIKNFSTGSEAFKGLFCRLNGATIKNLAMTNVSLAGTNAPLTSYIQGGNVTVENVFIDVKEDIGTRTSGLVGYQTSGTLTVKDVFISFPAAVSNAVLKGYISAYLGTEQTIDGVYCIGKNMDLHSGAAGSNSVPEYKNADGQAIAAESDYFVFDSAVSMYVSAAYAEISQFIKNNFEKIFADELDKVTDITADNIGVLELATDGYYRLTEDIDMSGITWGAQRAGKNYEGYYFTGTFDGNGHTIKNFTTGAASHAGGLLWSLQGATVKNIVFENAVVTATNGLIAGRTIASSLVTVENVAAEISRMAMSSAGLVCPSDANIQYKDTLVYVAENANTDIVKSGFLGGLYQRTAVVGNVFCISDTALELTPTGHPSIVTDVKTFGGTAAVEGTDYFMYGVEEATAQGSGVLSTELLKTAFAKFFAA